MSVEATLWGSNVMGRSFEERIEVARAGGFTATSIFPFEVAEAAERGESPQQLRQRHEEAGLRIAVLDPLARWLPTWRPPNAGLDDPGRGDFTAEQMFPTAEALGAEAVTVLALYDPTVDPAVAGPLFAELCDRAAEHGLRLQLEFIPGSGLHDLAAAWAVVEAADRPNGGVLLDTWHFFRSASSFELLAEIPAEKIFALQLEDAPVEPPPDLGWECLHARLVPGEGELDLDRLMATIAGKVPRLSGPEVFSDEFASLSPAQLGARLGDASRRYLG
jgi:sugar phosphate isomerase/epimerase